MRLSRAEARREINKIKGVYYAYSCRTKTWQFKNDSQEYSKVDVHGYVYTNPDSFYAFTGMEWV